MILIAMDSWKGSLSAQAAGEAVERGIHSVHPGLNTMVTPLADGGEGTLEIIRQLRPGEFISTKVTGPLPDRTVEDGYLFWSDTNEALVEMAKCSGLTLLTESERDPTLTTTRGVGEWILDAVNRGATTITLALGGSATVDGGSGMARALGWRFLDQEGRDLPEGGGALTQLASILPPEHRLKAEIRVMCDVTNPLLGEKGAASIFGPQKGATPEQVNHLERGLIRLANEIRRSTGRKIKDLPGAGAAGGMGAGCVGFLQGNLVSGIDEMLRISGTKTLIEQASHVITGEGRIDAQSLDGKVVSGILKAARTQNVPVSVIAGSCTLTESDLQSAGLTYAFPANEEDLPLNEAMARAEELAEGAGRRLAQHL